jgi:RimJ/RimL family protein N-acetyltransferase
VSLALPADGLRVDELLVRLPTHDDVPAVAPAFSDPELTVPAGLPFFDEDQLHAFLEDELADLVATGLMVPGVIVEAEDGAILGSASLHHWDPFRERAEVGYWLFPPARGRGIATRVVRALADHAFASGVRRLEAIVRLGNTSSERVLERVGFTREGVLRSFFPLHGGSDGTIYSLLPGE